MQVWLFFFFSPSSSYIGKKSLHLINDQTKSPYFKKQLHFECFCFWSLSCAFIFFCSCDPLQPPFSSVGMTNNAVEGGTMRGPQRALSPQHRCILAQGSPVVKEEGGMRVEWSRIKVIRHLILRLLGAFKKKKTENDFNLFSSWASQPTDSCCFNPTPCLGVSPVCVFL